MKKLMLGLIAVLSLTLIVAAFAYGPKTDAPHYDEDVHSQLEAALESRDYDTWIWIRQENNLPTHGRMFQMIEENPELFDRYAEMHEANEAGDYELAAKIRAEMGLGQGMKGHAGHRGSSQGGCHGGCQRAGAFVDGDGVYDNRQ